MRDVLETNILANIQGLAEFLPASNSILVKNDKWLVGNNLSGEDLLLMTTVLHVVTAIGRPQVARFSFLMLVPIIVGSLAVLSSIIW